MFKITIQQVDLKEEEEVIIRCHEINDDVTSLVERLKPTEQILLGSLDNEVFRIPIKDIYYIESVDNKTFIYLQKSVFDCKLKLYEIEAMISGSKLFRCSKSMIINLAKIRSVSPSVNGRFEAKLLNGEVAVISRQYVSVLKRKLGM